MLQCRRCGPELLAPAWGDQGQLSHWQRGMETPSARGSAEVQLWLWDAPLGQRHEANNQWQLCLGNCTSWHAVRDLKFKTGPFPLVLFFFFFFKSVFIKGAEMAFKCHLHLNISVCKSVFLSSFGKSLRVVPCSQGCARDVPCTKASLEHGAAQAAQPTLWELFGEPGMPLMNRLEAEL